MSDLAHEFGVSMPAFAPETLAALRGVISDLGQTHKPIDLTGAAVKDPTLWTKVLEVVAKDPQVGVTLCNFDIPTVATPGTVNMYDHIAAGVRAAGANARLMGTYMRPVHEHGRRWLSEQQMQTPLPSMAEGIHAVGRLAWWSRRVRD